MELVERALEGSQLAGARLIRLLEDEQPEGIEGLKLLYPHCGRAYLLGVTGPPGAGKSTLVDGLVAAFRQRDQKVAVIAVDPSSPFSGGAILGDRVRMQRHALDPGVFIRSMATRGQLGGLSRSCFETSLVFDAMGFGVIVIETVGVGQDELDVVDLAHTTAVVSIPGMGDGIQAMKAGILEIGDVFVINKGDLPGADEVERQLHVMLGLRDVEEGRWAPRLVRTVAAREEGIEALVDACLAHRAHLEDSGEGEARAQQRIHHFFVEMLRHRVSAHLLEELEQVAELRGLIDDLATRRIDPFSAVEHLVAKLRLEH